MSVLTAAAATAVAVSAQSAQAAPKPTTAQLRAQLQQLNTQADEAVQKYDGSQEQLQKQQAAVGTLQDQIARSQADVNSRLDQLGEIANQQYATGAVDPTVQLLLSSSPDDYLSKAASLGQLTSNQAAQIQQLQGEEQKLSGQKSQAEQTLQQIESTTKQLAAQKAEAQKKVQQTQALLDSMTAAERAAVTSPPSTSGGGSGNGGGGGVTVGVSVGGKAGDSVEAAAFAAAKTRLGLPYVYGATGPESFDCSGLMQWAYAQAGVSLGRTTYDQVNDGTPVSSVSDLQVGDLIFFNGDSHVGMYAGNGMVLHAPHTGTVVKFEPLSYIGSIYAMRHL
ncbi:C40 family peptidase [Streptacidiphilus neutrinimicus]|uniref:C40 family peptidase n=1 Tax=Streptacidiphilus neutrinimicus TaxID=105420 RepID=UPI00069320AE|nr:C40 family peptidase [Streptacidiphilus neutrinimicus]